MIEKYKSIASNISHDAYLELPSLGSSSIKYYAYAPYALKSKRQATKNMEFGTAFHSMVLEPEIFKNK